MESGAERATCFMSFNEGNPTLQRPKLPCHIMRTYSFSQHRFTFSAQLFITSSSNLLTTRADVFTSGGNPRYEPSTNIHNIYLKWVPMHEPLGYTKSELIHYVTIIKLKKLALSKSLTSSYHKSLPRGPDASRQDAAAGVGKDAQTGHSI